VSPQTVTCRQMTCLLKATKLLDLSLPRADDRIVTKGKLAERRGRKASGLTDHFLRQRGCHGAAWSGNGFANKTK
jgi:hypothetical protein